MLVCRLTVVKKKGECSRGARMFPAPRGQCMLDLVSGGEEEEEEGEWFFFHCWRVSVL